MNLAPSLAALAASFTPSIYRGTVKRRFRGIPLEDPARALDRAAHLLVNGKLASAAAWSFIAPEGLSGGGAGKDAANAPAGGETIFEVGSLTKVFTGLLLAEAATRSMLRLDDPIQEALPEASELLPPAWGLTWKQLATHTSGLPRLPYGFGVRRRLSRDPYAGFGAEALRQSLRRAPQTPPEVRRALYSNFGFGLLGYLLARLHHRSLAELFQERIIGPLELPGTTPGSPAGDQVARGRSRLGLLARRWSPEEAMAGAGCLNTTADGLTAFLSLNLRAARGGEAPLGSALRLGQDFQIRGIGNGLGLGWQITVHEGRVIRWHNGGTGGFSSFMGFCAENGRALALLTAGTGLAQDITATGLDLLRCAAPAEDTLRT